MKCFLGISNFLEEISAAAKLLQSCPTLCDPIVGSPPGPPVPGIPVFQARTLEWVAISFSNAWKWKVKSESEIAQSCPTLCHPWTAAYQAPPSTGFSRQEYWSGVPLPFSILLLPLFLCIVHLVRFSYLSLLVFGTLHSDGYIFSFLLCLLLLVFSSTIYKTSSDNHFAFFFLGDGFDHCLLYTVSNLRPKFFRHSVRSNPLNLFVTFTV